MLPGVGPATGPPPRCWTSRASRPIMIGEHQRDVRDSGEGPMRYAMRWFLREGLVGAIMICAVAPASGGQQPARTERTATAGEASPLSAEQLLSLSSVVGGRTSPHISRRVADHVSRRLWRAVRDLGHQSNRRVAAADRAQHLRERHGVRAATRLVARRRLPGRVSTKAGDSPEIWLWNAHRRRCAAHTHGRRSLFNESVTDGTRIAFSDGRYATRTFIRSLCPVAR